jgi:hypothetical protein
MRTGLIIDGVFASPKDLFEDPEGCAIDFDACSSVGNVIAGCVVERRCPATRQIRISTRATMCKEAATQ